MTVLRSCAALVTVACAVLLAGTPGAARASTIVSGPTLMYLASGGEANDVTITADATSFVITDTGASIVGCGEAGVETVRCARAGVTAIQVSLGDRDDRLQLDDSVYPAVTNVLSFGGDDDDAIVGGAGSDNAKGDAGADRIESGAGEDLLDGGAGEDVIDAGAGADAADGGDGGDEVVGADGDDVLAGGRGDDFLRGGAGRDVIDRPEALELTPERAAGADVLDGGDGDDVLSGGLRPDGADALLGGEGADTADYSRRASPVLVALDGQAGDGAPGEGDDVRGIEQVLGGADSDTLTGGDGPELLDGGDGDDLLEGRGGADTLEGGVNDGGSDGLAGGDGPDVLRGGPGDDALGGGAGDDALAGGGGSDALAGDPGEDLLAGGPGLDALAGGDGADVLYGGDIVLVGADGPDALDGDGGDDLLVAGPGDDTLDGGLGADRMSGEAGTDTVSYETRAAPVTVTFDGVANDGESGEGDNVLADVERVLGGAVADTLTGDERANALSGGSGEDYVTGGPGPDALAGGTASDVVDARDGVRDVVSCGPSLDLVVADRRDTLLDCDFADEPGTRRPVLGRTALARRARGRVAFRLPGARRSIPLAAQLALPLRSTLDARAGTVRLATRRRLGGGRQSAAFWGGLFSIRQRRARRAVTAIRLRGGDFSVCRAGRAGLGVARAAARKPVRRVWGRGRGRYRTRGRYSAGVVRGTTWLTEDRCDGTLTRVVTGVVLVRDFTRHRTVAVPAGHSYLAPASPAGRRSP